MRKTLTWCIFFCILAALALANLYCGNKSGEEVTEEASVTYTNHHDTVDYVGIESCRSCHAEKYETFIHTGMGQSFDTALAGNSSAIFSGHDVIYDSFSKTYYQPFLKDASIYVREFMLEGKDTLFSRTEKVSYIIGSGQHTNSHIISMNGYLYQAPFTWYAQDKKWDLPPGFEGGHNSRFQRIIGLECMSCHNAMPSFASGSENKFTKVPKGIDCERCHGPGERHVNLRKQGLNTDFKNGIDYSIVHPRKLPWKLQLDVCQRCHLQGNAVLRDGKNFTDFKPGQALSSVFDVFVPEIKDPSGPFIMASHAERLQLSPCFIQSNSNADLKKEAQNLKMTCITCHNPHISVQVTGKEVFNKACLNCHKSPELCTAHPAERKKLSDNCVSCHMPKSGTGDIPHVTIHDHYIRKPIAEKEAEKIIRFARLRPVNRKHTSEQILARAYIDYYEKFERKKESLDSAEYYLSRIKNPDLNSQIQLAYLRDDFSKVISLAAKLKSSDSKDAWTAYRIGQSYYNNGIYLSAEEWFARARELAPLSLEFATKYAVALMDNKKYDQAIRILQSVLDQQPGYSPALVNLGYAYQQKGALSLARSYYEKCLKLDYNNEAALRNLVDVTNLSGDKKMCRFYLERLHKLKPNDVLVKKLLDEIKS